MKIPRKRCGACKRIRQLRFFYNNASIAMDGKDRLCIDCRREANYAWRRRNYAAHLDYQRRYQRERKQASQ